MLAPVIAASWFTIDKGTYIYASVAEVKDPEKHLMVIRDEHEITIVTEMNNLPLSDMHFPVVLVWHYYYLWVQKYKAYSFSVFFINN